MKKTTSKQMSIKESNEKIRADLLQIELEHADFQEREQMDQNNLSKEAFELGMEAFKSRSLLWLRRSREFQNN